MAFISMFIVMIGFTVILIGLVFFLIAAVMDIIWVVRSSRKKKTHLAIKILAVIMSIIGFVLFVLPVGYLLINDKVSEIAAARKFNSIENKIYLDDSNDKDFRYGFEYTGMNLVRIDFVHILDDKKLTVEGALVYEDNQYYPICPVKNEGDFDIYVLQGTSYKYCEENQLQEIFDYYHEEAELASTIFFIDDESQFHEYKCDFDKDILFEIRGYYDTKEYDYSGSVSETTRDYRIEVKSSDGLFSESISLAEIGDNIVLEGVSGGGNMRGITLPEDKADYVRSQIRQWTDLY